MAQAVAVFRDNAVERIRLEREARDAANVRFAVDNLAAGLPKLSDGDVSHRISQPFVDTLDTVSHLTSTGRLKSCKRP